MAINLGGGNVFAREDAMKKSKTKLNITLSKPIYETLKKAKSGTNLTNSDIVEMVIRQYFSLNIPKKSHACN